MFIVGDRNKDDGGGGRLSAAAHSRRAERQTTAAKEGAQIASKNKQIASKDKQMASLEAELKAEREEWMECPAHICPLQRTDPHPRSFTLRHDHARVDHCHTT